MDKNNFLDVENILSRACSSPLFAAQVSHRRLGMMGRQCGLGGQILRLLITLHRGATAPPSGGPVADGQRRPLAAGLGRCGGTSCFTKWSCGFHPRHRENAAKRPPECIFHCGKRALRARIRVKERCN